MSPMIFPGQKLLARMDSESVTRLGEELRERVVEMEQEHAPLYRAMSAWWKWYEAVPRTQSKTTPWVGAANVVVPLIGIVCDALASRLLAQTTAAAPTYWTARSENEARSQLARNMARYINWQADGNEFSLKHVLSDQLLETFVIGRGVAALNYRAEVRPFFFGRTPLGGKARVSQSNVTVRRGPMVEHVQGEHIMWDRRLRIGDAPMVVRRHEWSWAQLRDMAKADGESWSREAVEFVMKFPGSDGGSDADRVEQTKAGLDLRDENALSLETHDVREVWVDWSMLGRQFEVPGREEWKGEQVPLLAHLHMQTGRVLRLVGMPYLLPYKPFIDFRFRGGRGVAKRLEMLQSISTTVVNQELDAGTRRNSFWGFTRDAALQRKPLDPSKLMLVSSMDDVQSFSMPQYTASNLNLMVALNTMAERWMGHNDPLLGRDTRSGGHPSPATSTLALLEQSGVMAAGTDIIIQEELSRLGEGIAILNQQFETNEDGRLQRILGEEDAAKVGPFLFPEEPIPGNYFFDVVALSRNENPDAQMQRALMVAQAYQNYGNLLGQGAMVIGNEQAPPQLKVVWAKLMEGYTGLLERFLDAANVDDTEKFLVQLDEIARAGRAEFAAAARGAAGAAGARQPGAVPGNGAAAGGAGGIAASGSPVGAGNGAASGAGTPFTGGGVLR
jgi:hypothetical protein